MRHLPLVSLAALVAASGCPEPECASFTDCPSGEVCGREGTCVPDTGSGGGGGGVIPTEGEGEGEGEGENETLIQLNAPVINLFVDPGDPTRMGVVEYLPSQGGVSTFDQVRFFDRTTGEDTGDDIDLLGANLGEAQACGVDTYTEFPNIAPLSGGGDEVWLSCRAPASPNAYIAYNDEFNNAALFSEGVGRAELVALQRDGEEQIEGRILVAARGASTLYAIQTNIDQDTEFTPRERDTFASDVSFQQIAGIFPVATNDDTDSRGSVVFVFDRGTQPPQLIPIYRGFQESEWQRGVFFDDALVPLDLPEGTHGVIFDAETINLENIPAGNNEPVANVFAFVPRGDNAGMHPLRYETTTSGGNSNFNRVRFPNETFLPTSLPPVTERVPLESFGSGDARVFFYAPTTGAAVWRFPVVGENENGDNDVRFQTMNAINIDTPEAIVPIDGDEVWVAIRNKNEIQRLVTDDGG